MTLELAVVTMVMLAAAEPSGALDRSADPEGGPLAVRVGAFGQEVRRFYATADGLPSDDVRSVAVGADGTVYAATAEGLALLRDGRWTVVPEAADRVTCVPDGSALLLRGGEALRLSVDGRTVTPVATLPVGRQATCIVQLGDTIIVGTNHGLWSPNPGPRTAEVDAANAALGADAAVHALAALPDASAWLIGAESGFFMAADGAAERLFPADDARSWAPRSVRAVGFGSAGEPIGASGEGLYLRTPTGWRLYEGCDGLPYNDFTALASGDDGILWLGTRIGAIRLDDGEFAYRQGLRWLPDDDVRDAAVGPDGAAWFATGRGLGCIYRRPMTLAEKAAEYEAAIARHHRRTEYGYVLEVRTDAPGDPSVVHQHDSDNDGLWTSVYGAGECFAYAALGRPEFKERADAAFRALRFLGEVTQGGEHPAPPGYVARTILPTSGPDPNAEHYTPERDRERQADDAAWKVMDPRWPRSADGKWYWKSDTSSDELDGHYFFYGLYYDLVAETEAERDAVRAHVAAITDHLLVHDYCLVDHDGLPTRWAVFSPRELNFNRQWFAERGLNSLSMLAYLAVAEHVTGDARYREAADVLIEQHGYLQNVFVPKIHNGPGTGNHSDDEMAFMNYYHLLAYDRDPERREVYAFSLYRYWRMEEPEVNPFFNFIAAAMCRDASFSDPFGAYELGAEPAASVPESVRELMRFPLDRFNWRHTNSHRLDIAPLPKHAYLFDAGSRSGAGSRVDGRVLPVDERYFEHWNHNPWRLDSGGDGRTLATGTVYLLPYYMGLYHGFIEEEG